MCCKLMGVKSIDKPADSWCADCDIGKGCKIYDARPADCANFNCLWKKGMFSQDHRPDKIKVIWSDTTHDHVVQATVDAGRFVDDALIDLFLRQGFHVVVRKGTKSKLCTSPKRAVPESIQQFVEN